MSNSSEPFDCASFVLENANKLATWRKKSETYWFRIICIIDNNKGDIKKFDCYKEFEHLLNIEHLRTTQKYQNITITQLFEWLKIDNIKVYNEIKHHRIQEAIKILHDFSEANVSRIFYNIKPDDYIYIDGKGWYSVNENNLWIFNDKMPTHMPTNIDRTMIKFINEAIDIINEEEKKINENENISHKEKIDRNDEIDELRKEVKKLLKKFGKDKLNKSMLSYLKSYYNNNEALDYMDSKPNLFSCNNKVFDCLTGEWRDIKQTDYIFKNTGYAYSPKRNKDIETKIYNFFMSCFETKDKSRNETKDKLKEESDEPEVYEYFLSVIARCLNGNRNSEDAQKFYILKGNGRNGKGLSFRLIERVFNEGSKSGGYYKCIEHQEITKPQTKANEPLPGIANSKGKRIVLTTEPGDNDYIQVDIVKKITGGDTLQYRDLFQRGEDAGYKAQYGLFLQTNHSPYFKLDSAFLNRLIVINYPYKFKSKYEIDETDTSQKIADNEIGNLFSNNDEYRLEFLHILVDIYRKYHLKNKSIPIPTLIKDYTKEVSDINNLVGVWLEKNYKKVSDITDTKYWVKTTELLTLFKHEMNSSMYDKEFLSQMEYNKFNNVKATSDVKDTNIKKNNSIFKGISRITTKPMITL